MAATWVPWRDFEPKCTRLPMAKPRMPRSVRLLSSGTVTLFTNTPNRSQSLSVYRIAAPSLVVLGMRVVVSHPKSCLRPQQTRSSVSVHALHHSQPVAQYRTAHGSASAQPVLRENQAQLQQTCAEHGPNTQRGYKGRPVILPLTDDLRGHHKQ